MRNEKNVAIFTAYEEIEPFDPQRPERNLLFAVLLSALNDLQKHGELKRKATNFFLDPEDDYIFSFQAICDYLSLDPKRVLYIAGLRNEKCE